MKIIDYNSNFYPSSLKKIKNPPKKLYAIGNVNLLNTTCFSIVGSRVCSKYGMEMAKFFSKELSFQNLTIVSGMALGIDAISHHSTLNVEDTQLPFWVVVLIKYFQKKILVYIIKL